MAQPPGAEFGGDFYKYMLGPTGEVLSNFLDSFLTRPSGVPALGVPGLTAPGTPQSAGVPQAGPDPQFRVAGAGPDPGFGVVGAGPDPGFRLPSPDVASGPFARIAALNAGQVTNKAPLGALDRTANMATGAAPQTAGPMAVPAAAAPNVKRFASLIKQAAAETGVPEDVLAAIVHVECAACDPNTVRQDSRATGIAQVVGGPVDPLENLRAAGRLLLEKQRIWGIRPDDWNSTAAAYFGAYNPSRGGITGDRDVTGTNGFGYVDNFAKARQLYTGGLVLNTQGTPLANQPATYAGVADRRPSQFDPWLSKQEQYAACGPATAAALSGKSVREMADLGSKLGVWSTEGMTGVEGEWQLLEAAGVKSTINRFNVQQIASQLGTGKPVVVSTARVSDAQPGHYFVVDEYNPQTGQFHVGTSGTDLKAGGPWMTAAQMAVTGPINGVLYIQ